jgi:hypothetical protein
VNIRVRDVGETVALTLGGGGVSVASTPHPKPHVEILADAESLMAMPAVPLRFGFPDATTPDGRALTRDILRRKVIVRGLAAHPGLVRRVQLLLSVSR